VTKPGQKPNGRAKNMRNRETDQSQEITFVIASAAPARFGRNRNLPDKSALPSDVTLW
jgi:hypothetical protein